MLSFDDLTDDERIALVGLFKLVVSTDSQISDDESLEIVRIARLIGEQRFIDARREAQRRFSNHAAIRAFVETVQRPEARELLYQLAVDVARTGTVSAEERAVLDWLAQTWNLTPKH